jgi:hypothetical protein
MDVVEIREKKKNILKYPGSIPLGFLSAICEDCLGILSIYLKILLEKVPLIVKVSLCE